MPDIIFFSPVQMSHDYQSSNSDTISVGRWTFTKTGGEPVYRIHPITSMNECVGYNITYSNDQISQEETDHLMYRYRKETNQLRENEQ